MELGEKSIRQEDTEAPAPYTFEIQLPDTVLGPTIDLDSELEADSVQDGGMASPPVTPIPSQQESVGTPSTPLPSPSSGATGSITPGVQPIQWATPPSGAIVDSEGVPLRYRTVFDLLESTDEVANVGLCLVAAEEPASVEEAMTEECWRQAMQTEMKAIEDNRTWEVAELPAGQKAIGLKWVFKVKKDANGKILKHKARLVAKGYAQVQGVDFDEVFAPVARIETVIVLLALAAEGGWQVHHMDVKSAFLNGDLTETVFVRQPPGFVVGKGDKVLKLRKALYGLRQAPRAWNSKLDKELIALGFVRSKLEHAVYRRSNKGSFLLVGVYVDDLVICGPSVNDISQFKKEMMRKFNMSDLGLLSYYLGIEVKQGADGITLSQSAYAVKILENAGMLNCNPTATPMEARLKLGKREEDEVVRPSEYRSIIGSLRYIVNTRPDLAFSVGVVSRFMEAPSRAHWGCSKANIKIPEGHDRLWLQVWERHRS
jgi:hypothetical protein